MRRTILTGIAVLAVSGCGGVNSTPTPTPSPSPTPGPTPSPTNTTLTNLQYSESFANRGAALNFTAAKATGAPSNVSGGSAAVTVAYDAPTQTYTISTNGRSQSFGPQNRVAPPSPNLDTFDRTAGNVDDTLALYKPGLVAPALSLTYASYGAWQQSIDNGNSVDAKQVYFVYGIRTPSTDLPRTGTASYATLVDGFWTDPQGLYSIGGSSSFSADFANAKIATSMNLTGTSVLNGTTRAFGFLNGSGTIASDASFSGTLSGGAGYNGTIDGLFFGPAAAEMGGAFSVTNNTGGVLTGAIVGKKN